jgi:thiamine kinase-like enzyme
VSCSAAGTTERLRPSPKLAERVGRLLDARPVSWEPRAAPWQPTAEVAGGNERFSVLLDDGRRVFVKAARAEYTAASLRREHEVYAHLRGSFIAQLVAFEDDPLYPILVLEDLSDADWDVRWEPERVELVGAALAELAASEPPPNTGRVQETFADLFGRWHAVAEDPEPFLSTGVRSREWLESALPTLVEAANAVPADGDDLLHLDVRSDNLCFREGAVVLVDWNWCSIGNAELDVAAWLPSLAIEGGPQPWEILPRAGEFAAFLAGVWAAVVGLAPPETAPTVRPMQRRQLEVALAWCERELGLLTPTRNEGGRGQASA